MDYVPELPSRDEIPERTVENVPNNMLEKIVLMNCKYRLCPHCEEGQWFYYNSGHTRNVDCVECGDEVTLIG